MNTWKKVNIDFPTIKLGDFIEPIKTTVTDLRLDNPVVYGVTNIEGITQTGKPASKDLGKYIALEKDCFAYNPYRINVGSIGINELNLQGCVSPAYVVFKTKNGLLPKFLFHYIKSEFGIHLINWYGNKGGVRNALRFDDLCKIDIPDITKLNQEEILTQLDEYKDKIQVILEEIESQKAYAKQLRQNILQDAIEGKLTVEWRKTHPVIKGNPDFDAEALFEEIQKGKAFPSLQPAKQSSATPSAGSNAARNARSKELPSITDDEKPFEIPDGWKWVRLGEVCKKITDGTHKTPSYKTDGIKFVSAKDIYNGYLSFEACKYISKEEHSVLYRRCNPEKDDLLISKSGSIGTVVLNTVDFEFSLFESLALIKYSKKLLLPFYFQQTVQLICNKLTRDDIKGVCVKHLHLNVLSNQSVPLVPIAEQVEIAKLMRIYSDKIKILDQQISKREEYVNQLMQSILKDAFEEK